MSSSRYADQRPAKSSGTEAGIVDLIRDLADDSKRLAGDEVRLAKLEVAAHVRDGGRGAMQLGIAFGAGVVAVSALTICVIAALTLLFGRVWIAAIVTGAIELILAYLLITRGAHTLEHPAVPPLAAALSPPPKDRGVTSGRAD